METKITQYQHKLTDALQRLRDVRFVGMLVFLGIVLLVSWSGVKVIDTNYRLQKQIASLEQQTLIARLRNDNLRLSNEYYQTDQYLDITARQNFGLAAPGETVIVVPQAVALAATVDMPDAEAAVTKETNEKQPAYQRNFQAWMDFFFHRQNRIDPR